MRKKRQYFICRCIMCTCIRSQILSYYDHFLSIPIKAHCCLGYFIKNTIDFCTQVGDEMNVGSDDGCERIGNFYLG